MANQTGSASEDKTIFDFIYAFGNPAYAVLI